MLVIFKPNRYGLVRRRKFSIVESSTRGGRLKFYEMLEFVKQQKHKTAIVVNCVDRLQRGYKECVELDELRKQGRIEIHFYKEGFYLHKDSNSSDIMRWDIGVFSAKTYVGSLRDNVIRSQEYKREQGQWQSCAPVGYLNVSKTKTTPADIIIDEERAPKVKRLFEEYAKGGRTLQDITNLARTLGLYSKMCTVNKTISRAQVQNILKNTFYIGYFTQKGKVYKHHYPRFIDEELFHIVQNVMEGRKRAPSKLYYGDKQYIFTGLVRCGCCGSLMTCETKVKDAKHSYNYLKCHKLRSKCSQKPLNEEKILKQLEEELCLPMNISDEMLKNIKSEVKKQLKEERVNTATLKRDITIKITEVKNSIQAYDLLLSLKPYQEKDLLKAHKLMMQGLVDNNGKYRTDGVGVFNGKEVVHLAPPASRVPLLMLDLFKWLKNSDMHPLIKSCVFHYEFEFIHPFQDGNGRMGRLWQTVILKEWKEVFAWLPVETLVKENQEEYYNALGKSDAAGDSTRFIEFMLTLIFNTIEEIIKSEKKVTVKVGAKVTVNQQKIMDAIKVNPFITQEELADIVGIAKKNIIANMKKLQTNGLIKRVGADKNGHWLIGK